MDWHYVGLWTLGFVLGSLAWKVAEALGRWAWLRVKFVLAAYRNQVHFERLKVAARKDI